MQSFVGTGLTEAKETPDGTNETVLDQNQRTQSAIIPGRQFGTNAPWQPLLRGDA